MKSGASNIFRLRRFSRHELRRRVIGLLLILILAYFAVWFVSSLYDYQIVYYEPADSARGALER